MAWYVARIENQDGRYAISFPDVPTLRVVQDTLEDALDLAAWTLACELDAWRAKGISPHAPTPLSEMNTADSTASYGLVEIADEAEEIRSGLVVPATGAQAPRAASANTR